MSENRMPAPWKYDGAWMIMAADGREVFEIADAGDGDAHMGAAAPELYAALKCIVDGMDDEWCPLFPTGPLTSDELKALEAAKAAIAKAEGRDE